jgi:Fe-S-cluster containining protein
MEVDQMPSQEYLKEIAENIDNLEIGLDDSFRFKCYGCGKCCKNREDILLSPKDLFNIAVALGKTTVEIMASICDRYIGGGSRIPLVRLQPIGKNQVCPLLKDNRCAVHALKPAVCALYPLGRFVKYKADNGSVDLSGEASVSYLLNPIECGGHRNNTVRSWLESFGLDTNDPYYLRWTDFFMGMSNFVRELESAEHKLPQQGFAAVWSILEHLLYENYDTAQDFMPQFEGNIAKAKELIDRMNRELFQPFLKGEMPDES